MKKVLYSLPVMIVLCFAFSLSAFAATGLKDYVFVRCTGGIYDQNGNFVEKTVGFFDNSSNEPNTSLIRINYTDSTGIERYTGLRLALIAAGYIKVNSGYYFEYTLTIDETVTVSPDMDLKAYVLTSDKSLYELNVSYTRDSYTTANTNIEITVGGRVGDGHAIQFGALYLDFKGIGTVPSGFGSYTLVCSNTITTHPTPDQLRHDELIGEIESVKDSIIYEDFGYSTPEDFVDIKDTISESNSIIGDFAQTLGTYLDQISFSLALDYFDEDISEVFWFWFKPNYLLTFSVVTTSLLFLLIRKVIQ